MVTRKPSSIVSRNAGVAPSRTLLNANTDFTFLGRYTLAQYGGFNSTDMWSMGLTHRYVDGVFRLVWIGNNGNGSPAASYQPIRQGTLPGSYGSNINIVATHNNTWPSGGFYGLGSWHSLWWDEANQLLWSSSGIDYPTTTEERQLTACFMGRKIGNTSGDCFDYTGWHGLYGRQQRSVMGKMGRVPTWAQSAYGMKSHITLSGGYASIMASGVSLGPSFYSFDDPAGFTSSNTFWTVAPTIPEASVQRLADCTSGTTSTDWYAGGYASRVRERGCRVTNVLNEYDAGGWLSKPDLQPPGDPDGWNRWVWGDTFGGSGNWIDNNAGTRNKHGVVMIQKLSAVRAWYQGSQLNTTGIAFEICVYDPADMYAVKQGTLDAWKIRPKSIAVIPESHITPDSNLFQFYTEPYLAATFDDVTSRLYMLTGDLNGRASISVYQVAT